MATAPEARHGAFVEDKYSIAVINNGKTVGHVPKFLTKLTFFFLKNGGKLHITVTGPRRYSVDLIETSWIGIATRLLFYFAKWKTVSSNESEYIGRIAEV